MFHPGGGLLPVLFSILTSVVSVVAAAIVFLVVLGVLFLLVRFLWFGTRAAQVYLVKNGEPGRFTWPVRPVGEPEPGATAAPAPGRGPEPERAPRKPKAPPAS
ncbi:hypothetical protein ACEXQE_15585 [Herbiconiux sp. P17]|uniref:hypothetical protein n=1 Tax=Herbiconiux wuyangfengii TaxID=3342794 RepID=UPI0035B7B606